MSSPAQNSGKAVGHVDIIQDEIKKARDDRRPTSRQTLAEIVHERSGMPIAEALQLVDSYCETEEPAIPYYLQEEFAIPYLKFIAIMIVLGGIAFIWYGVTEQRKGRPAYVWYSLGTVVIGLGVFAWVQSLEKYVERRKRRSTAK
jgi:hypothetical protein